MPSIKVGTANTYLGKVLEDSRGLEPLADADILLLQEVDPVADRIDDLVRASDFRVSRIEQGTGLAILHRDTVSLTAASTSLLQRTPVFQRRIMQVFREHDLKTIGRGTAQAEFETSDSTALTVVSAHANVPVRRGLRREYLRLLSKHMRAINGPVVLGGDMNHWPGPHKGDKEMATAAGLERVDIGDQPTYTDVNSKHAWIGRASLGLIDVNAQLDSMLFTPEHLEVQNAEVRDIASDHRAIVTTFGFI